MVKKMAKNLDEIAKKIQTKKNLGWNHQIVNENQIIDNVIWANVIFSI